MGQQSDQASISDQAKIVSKLLIFHKNSDYNLNGFKNLILWYLQSYVNEAIWNKCFLPFLLTILLYENDGNWLY